MQKPIPANQTFGIAIVALTLHQIASRAQCPRIPQWPAAMMCARSLTVRVQMFNTLDISAAQ